MKLGFSTGCLYKTHDSLAPETINIFRKLGCNAIEVMFHSVEAVEDFKKLRPVDFQGFDFVSIHAPIYRGPHQKDQYIEALKVIEKTHKKVGFDSIVLHPDMFTLEEFEFLKRFDLPYVIENMDNRKESCKNVEDLRKVFDRINAPFLLDVNHVYSNDSSMKLVDDLIEKFGHKLVEIHLSGFDTFHDPLFATKQTQIMDAIPDINIPIIIESVINEVSDLQKELDYVRNYLTR